MHKSIKPGYLVKIDLAFRIRELGGMSMEIGAGFPEKGNYYYKKALELDSDTESILGGSLTISGKYIWKL